MHALNEAPRTAQKKSDPTLRLYAIARGDIHMPPGKLAAQCGHAFLGAHLRSMEERPEIAREYADLDPGTKIALIAPDLEALETACDRARALGIPCSLITDRGHVLPPDFDGSPIVTALGLGPATRDEVKRITRDFALAP